MSVPASEIAKILGGRRVLGRTVSNMRELGPFQSSIARGRQARYVGILSQSRIATPLRTRHLYEVRHSALLRAGWDDMRQIREEGTFAKGRLNIPAGQPVLVAPFRSVQLPCPDPPPDTDGAAPGVCGRIRRRRSPLWRRVLRGPWAATWAVRQAAIRSRRGWHWPPRPWAAR